MSDINSILKNLDWNTRRPFGWSSSPDADWKVIFMGTLLLILLVSAFNAILFFAVDKGYLAHSEIETVSETPTLDVNKLKETLSRYQNRAAEFKRLTSGTAAVVGDPSI